MNRDILCRGVASDGEPSGSGGQAPHSQLTEGAATPQGAEGRLVHDASSTLASLGPTEAPRKDPDRGTGRNDSVPKAEVPAAEGTSHLPVVRKRRLSRSASELGGSSAIVLMCHRCLFQTTNESELQIHMCISHSSSSPLKDGEGELAECGGSNEHLASPVDTAELAVDEGGGETEPAGMSITTSTTRSTEDKTAWPFFHKVSEASNKKAKLRLYPCPYKNCNYTATQGSNRKKHLANVHGENVIWHMCEEMGCQYKSKQKGHLKNHYAKVHSYVFCTFKGCDFGAPSAAARAKHEREVHPRQPHR